MNDIADTYDYKKDEYYKWLSIANSGMLDRGNLECMRYALRNIPTGDPIIEIGSFCGLSLNALTYYKNSLYKIPNKIFNCDKWIFEGNDNPEKLIGLSGIKRSEYQNFIKETYKRNVEFFSRGELPHTIEKFSDEFFASWSEAATVTDLWGRETALGGPISFAYIDGNHTYDYVKRDFENVDRFLVKSGFILLDDSADSNAGKHMEGVNILCREIEASSAYKLVMKNPNYLFVKL